MDKTFKTFSCEIKEVEGEERVLRFTTSTEAVDRDGDIIDVKGWQLDNYMKNPVILFGHDYRGLPVGKTVKIRKDTKNGKLIQDVQFARKEDYPFADTVYRLAKNGYINATSVGFMGIEREPIRDDDGNYKGMHFIKQELLETSIVPVPCNPEALQSAKEKGVFTKEDFAEYEKAFGKLKEHFEELGDDKVTTALKVKIELSDEFTKALDLIKQMIEAYKKETDEEIKALKETVTIENLTVVLAKEFAKIETKDDDIDIEPEEVKELMDQIFNEYLKGGNQNE